MDFVEPIRDKRKIAQIKNQLDGAERYRDLLLFVVGINTALRISDLLQLRIEHFFDRDGNQRDKFVIHEEKYGKRNQVTINTSIQQALKKYLGAYQNIISDSDHFLFFSSTRTAPDYTRPISRVHAWRLISEMCASVGLSGNYGTHSLRKTWGYHARQSGVPLELIMHKLNHSDITTTKRYLGITDDELQAVAENLNL